MRISLFLSGLLLGSSAFSVEETGMHAIDKVTIYEDIEGQTHARLKLQGITILNPGDNATPCDLWIKNTMALDTALQAAEMQSPVQVSYEARGDAPDACQVRAVAMKNGVPSIDQEWQLAKRADRLLNPVDAFNQEDGNIGILDDNTYISVWASGDATGDGQTIQAQRISKSAYAVDSVFQISSSTPGAGKSFHSPMITALQGGNFVVAWQLEEPGVSTQLYYRVFDSALSEVKAETQIASTHTSAFAGNLVRLANGGFGVVSILEGDNKLAIHLFDHQGNETHAHIATSHAPVTGQWRAPSMAQLDDGRLLIAFGNDATQLDSIILATYDPDTDTLTDQTTFGLGQPTDVNEVKLVLLNDGSPAVAYDTDGNIKVQFFYSNLTIKGQPVQVNQSTFVFSKLEALALKDGSLLVAWEDNNGFDNDGKGIYLRRVDDEGELVGARLRLHSETTGDQSGMRFVQSMDDGDVVAMWDSAHSGDKDVYMTQIGVGQLTTRPTTNTRVGKVKASDPDGTALTYSLTWDAGGRFKIHSTKGIVQVQSRSLIDSNDAQSYTITVKVTDGASSVTRNFVIKMVE